jgi:recombination protein RecT
VSVTTAVARTDADRFRSGFASIVPQIKATLPAHIPFEKFERVAMMAVQRDPDLMKTDHRTLFLELQKCAADGLLPDARQAVIVRRWNSKLNKEAATYQPMVAGLRILMRNSGEVAALHAQVVYEGEPFRIVLGDEERIEHERIMGCVDDAKIIGAYAVATLKDGEKIREFMSWPEIEKARNVNKYWAKGPWASWKAEMCRKTVVRRLFKSVPQSTDKNGDRLQNAIERGDDTNATETQASPIMTIEGDAFESASAGTLIDPQTGEVTDADTTTQDAAA